MGWQRYLVHDFFTAQELNRVESEMNKLRRNNRSRNRDLLSIEADVEQLEMDLGRAYLLIGALTEICVRKKVFSEEELNQVMHEIDIRDGSADGRVARDWETDSAHDISPSPEHFLRQLEREDIE